MGRESPLYYFGIPRFVDRVSRVRLDDKASCRDIYYSGSFIPSITPLIGEFPLASPGGGFCKVVFRMNYKYRLNCCACIRFCVHKLVYCTHHIGGSGGRPRRVRRTLLNRSKLAVCAFSDSGNSTTRAKLTANPFGGGDEHAAITRTPSPSSTQETGTLLLLHPQETTTHVSVKRPSTLFRS